MDSGNMNGIIAFCSVVITSGWLLGYFLSRSMKGKTTPTPTAMLLSFRNGEERAI